ncbi:hypothetical protein Tco_1350199, partial [Tanacetum coccineum]
MFWHYAKDDFMFTIVRVISKHQDTQVYGALLPQHLINQAMLEFEAYITYRAYATSEKTPKPKSTKKKADSESSPNTKPIQASKGKTIKTSAKGDKPATNSHANGSGDGVDIQSKVPDEQQQTLSSTNEGAGDKPENVSGETESDDDRDDFVHPNLSTYKEDDQEEEKANDDDEVSSDQRVFTPPDYELTEEEENQEDDDKFMGGEQEDEEDEELYGDLNLILDTRDAVMTDAQTNQETEEAHVTLTTKPPVAQQQSLSDTPVNVSVPITTVTPSSDTTIPQTPIPIIQPQQQTHDSTTTITIPITTLPKIPIFASLFGFERRVSSLETELPELKQTNQFAEALSSIPSIVDNYLASKMKEAVDVAVQLKS